MNPIENPCVMQGCDGLKCGDECLSGDILGFCNANGICSSNVDQETIREQCGKFEEILIINFVEPLVVF